MWQDDQARGPAGASRRLERLVTRRALEAPDRRAVVDESGILTYAELDRWSDSLAHGLIDQGLRGQDRVCLLVPKSARAVAAILAALKGGAVYVPLDTASPPARLAGMLRQCAPCWLVATADQAELVRSCLDQLDGRDRPMLCWLGAPPPGAENQLALPGGDPGASATATPRCAADEGSPAYILFTSGSTGQPKGVPITHAHVEHFVSWANAYFGLGPHDRVSGHAPLHFDLSVWDVFGALSAGAELHLVPERANLMPSLTAEFIRQSRLTQWFSVPAVLVGMANRDVVGQGDFPDLERVIWAGEVFPTPRLRYWMQRLPHVRFTNLYGPTETTIAATYHTVTSVPADDAGPVPLGTAIPGRRLEVRDDVGRVVGPGELGELFIGGEGVSAGYWRDPERTAAAFRQADGTGGRWYATGDLASADADGLLHFHGRADRQIKSRGHRIELDEIARALSHLAELSESAVVAVADDGLEGSRICAAYVPAPDTDPAPKSLRDQLASALPSYMLPRRWLALEELPRNQNGKVDHRALELLFAREGASR